MPIDTAATIAGLDALARRVNDAVEAIVRDAAHLFQEQAMVNAPVGVAGNSTNTPGDLRRSIHVDGPHGGDGTYSAKVGPTVVTANPGPGGTIFNYGRQREFGGTIYPRVSKALVFSKFGSNYSRPAVYQAGSHYLLRAREERHTDVETIIAAHLTEAVEG